MKVTTMPATWMALGPQDETHPYYIMLFGTALLHGYFGLPDREAAKSKAEEALAKDPACHAAAIYTIDQGMQNKEILRRVDGVWQPWL